MAETREFQKSWLNVEEAADFLGLKKSTLYQYVADRRIPHYKPRGSNLLRFRISELDAWLEEGRIETREEYLHRMKGASDGHVAQKNGSGRGVGG